MARALSDDLRIRVLKASAAGMSARQAASRFGVGVSTAIRWIARAVEGEPTPRPQGWKRPSLLDAHEAFVVEMIDDRKVCRLSGRSASAGARLGHGYVVAAGRLKKVRTRIGAGPTGRPEAPTGLV